VVVAVAQDLGIGKKEGATQWNVLVVSDENEGRK